MRAPNIYKYGDKPAAETAAETASSRRAALWAAPNSPRPATRSGGSQTLSVSRSCTRDAMPRGVLTVPREHLLHAVGDVVRVMVLDGLHEDGCN